MESGELPSHGIIVIDIKCQCSAAMLACYRATVPSPHVINWICGEMTDRMHPVPVRPVIIGLVTLLEPA